MLIFIMIGWLGLVQIVLPSAGVAQVKQMILYGNVRIDDTIPPESTKVYISNPNSTAKHQAIFFADSGSFGTSISSLDGFLEGDPLRFHV